MDEMEAYINRRIVPSIQGAVKWGTTSSRWTWLCARLLGERREAAMFSGGKSQNLVGYAWRGYVYTGLKPKRSSPV